MKAPFWDQIPSFMRLGCLPMPGCLLKSSCTGEVQGEVQEDVSLAYPVSKMVSIAPKPLPQRVSPCKPSIRKKEGKPGMSWPLIEDQLGNHMCVCCVVFNINGHGPLVRHLQRDSCPTTLGVDSPLFSTIVIFNNQLFPQRCWWLSGKKDPWKEWNWKLPLDQLFVGCTTVFRVPPIKFPVWLRLRWLRPPGPCGGSRAAAVPPR